MTRPLAIRLAIVVTIASAGAWWLLDTLPWPARAFTTLLLVPLPVLLLLQGKLIDTIPEDAERESVYLSSALSVWVLAGFAMLAARFSDFDRGDLRLVPLPASTLIIAALLTVAVGLGVMVMGRVLRMAESPMVQYLIPRSSHEKIAFVGLSFSAGIAEEVVFRSFLIAALFHASGSMAIAVGVSVVVFAAAHAYQGWSGTLRVGLLGLVLTAPFLITGSVYPSIIAHVTLDILAGLVLVDWLDGPPRDD